MTDIVITRWKRYGHDRAYAALPDGTKLGFLDLKTSDIHLEDAADGVEVTQALWSWAADEVPNVEAEDAVSGAAEQTEAPATPAPTDGIPEEVKADDGDLALREPGQQIKEQARKAWEAEKRAGTFIAWLGRAIDADTDERAWRRGIEGEQVIGAALDKARKHGWKVLHSIPVGKESDIDHLVIGPGGVVLINTKHHKGAKVTVRQGGIYVNGSQTRHVLQVRDQVKRASKALSAAMGEPVDIQGCVAIHNGGLMEPEVKFAHHFKDVWVVTRWNIVRVLRKAEPVLTPDEVDAIYSVARRSNTWV